MTQSFKIINGDCLSELSNLPSNFFDAVLSDPPYGLSFMGKEWDKGVPSTQVYEQLLRVVKPGAFGIHFGGTRTFHRLAVNLEDAGFEMRDCFSWLYGSGFPKSYNISKGIDKAAGAERRVVGAAMTENARTAAGWAGGQIEVPITAPSTPSAKTWDGYGTALKPAWEPALLVMKPLDKNFVNNVLNHGCGALNIDGSRIGQSRPASGGDPNRFKAFKEQDGCPRAPSSNPDTRTDVGRFPANLLLDEVAAEALGEPSRFFYTAKVSSKERNAGCEHLEGKFAPAMNNGIGGKEHNPETATFKHNNHPTLKPISLTTYLAKLLLPPKQEGITRRILVPFSGAGSEMIGCLQAGWDEVWGIELGEEYVEIAKARITHWTQAAPIAD